jgi:hypothetical protein
MNRFLRVVIAATVGSTGLRFIFAGEWPGWILLAIGFLLVVVDVIAGDDRW